MEARKNGYVGYFYVVNRNVVRLRVAVAALRPRLRVPGAPHVGRAHHSPAYSSSFTGAVPACLWQGAVKCRRTSHKVQAELIRVDLEPFEG